MCMYTIIYTYVYIYTHNKYIYTHMQFYPHICIYIIKTIHLINVVKCLQMDPEVMMLEKAFAKLCGSYAATEAGITDPWLSS